MPSKVPLSYSSRHSNRGCRVCHLADLNRRAESAQGQGAPSRSKVDTAKSSLLTGMLTDGHGNRFTPSHAVRSGRRYRYYVPAAPIGETGADRGQVRRLPTQEVEGAMIRMLVEALTSPARLLERFERGPPAPLRRDK